MKRKLNPSGYQRFTLRWNIEHSGELNQAIEVDFL